MGIGLETGSKSSSRSSSLSEPINVRAPRKMYGWFQKQMVPLAQGDYLNSPIGRGLYRMAGSEMDKQVEGEREQIAGIQGLSPFAKAKLLESLGQKRVEMGAGVGTSAMKTALDWLAGIATQQERPIYGQKSTSKSRGTASGGWGFNVGI